VVAERQHLYDVAFHMATVRFKTARQPGRLGLLKTLREAATTAQAAAIALRDYDTATATALGVQPPQPPVPFLLMLGESLARLEREITPSPPVSAPPRPGYIKVRAVAKFTDSDGRVHWPDADASLDWMPEADTRVAITENKWAEPVDA
jgi:hypothetical protein